MTNERLDTSFLDDALARYSREAQHNVADALACHLHNTGYELEGNTEGNDVEWFARNLYERLNSARTWDRASVDELLEWRAIARRVIEVMPSFQLRVAHRLIALSKVTTDIERSLRRQEKAVTA